MYNKRRYKPLVFSNLQFTRRKFQPSYQLVNGEATLQISSMKTEICVGLVEGIWKKKGLQLVDCHLPLVEVKILPDIEFHEVMRYKSLSPVVVASQVDGRVHYCHPLESRFYDQLRYTLSNWYEIVWEKKLEGSVDIALVNPTTFNLQKSSVLTEIKKKKIKGYMLDLEVNAHPKVQKIIYEQGFGNYSVQGYGYLHNMEVRN
jgi:CRISPR-associated endoribonuclease Cas6